MSPEFSDYWKELVTICGFGLLWWKNGRAVGQIEQSFKQVADESCKTKQRLDGLTIVTPDYCEECQKHCQERTWDKFLLAIEKRDREFDRKFSAICQGISEIKTEVRRK